MRFVNSVWLEFDKSVNALLLADIGLMGLIEENCDSKAEGEGIQTTEQSIKPEPPKDYIHVRARRVQAKDSHSLPERITRQEKISERICSKNPNMHWFGVLAQKPSRKRVGREHELEDADVVQIIKKYKILICFWVKWVRGMMSTVLQGPEKNRRLHVFC